ncbi:MAG: hypothetical protein ACKVOR_10590 [Flavobacteriales bacterium]
MIWRLAYLNSLLILFAFATHAQSGLEGIVVEKYYVSCEADRADSLHSGNLPVGSVTYRIFVDLKPGYRFQAAYGAPGHPLFIESTQLIYNHIEAGTTHPNVLPERTLSEDIALLDSWLSVGAAGENHLGIPKTFDNEDVDEYITFDERFLKNKKNKKDITPIERDGMQRSLSLPFPTFFQMDTCLKHLGSSTTGKRIETSNGAWACMGKGSMGVDSLTTNTILIAQITTAGDLSFQLNIMIGTPDGKSERYVAVNPAEGELTHESLSYTTLKKQKTRKRGQQKKKKAEAAIKPS